MSESPDAPPRSGPTLSPALAGALVAGLLSVLPVIAHGNRICCLWAWVGGGVAALLKTRALSRLLSLNEAAFVGLLSGLLTSLLLMGVFATAINSPEAARALGEELARSYPPERLEELDQALPALRSMREELLAGRPATSFLLLSLCILLFTLPHMSALGAVAVTLWLRRRYAFVTSRPTPRDLAVAERQAVLLVRPVIDPGPYRSLERVEASTRQALQAHFEVIEAEVGVEAGRKAFLEAFERVRPRVVAVFDMAATFLTSRHAPEIPVLVWALGNLPHAAPLLTERQDRYKPSDLMLVNCESDRRIALNTVGADAIGFRVVPFGVDTDAFRPLEAAERRALRKELGVPRGGVLLCYAGRINVQKNVHGLLRLLASVRDSSRRPVRLALAGVVDEIPLKAFGVTNEGYRERLERDMERLGLRQDVLFLGPLDDAELARLYAAADVYTTATLHANENFGYAPVEAMACGTPVLASHWGGLKDSVLHDATGYHMPTLMTDHGVRVCLGAGAASLGRLVEDGALRRRLGRRARRHALRRYGLEAFAAQLASAVRDAAVAAASWRPGPPAVKLHAAAVRVRLRRMYMQARHERYQDNPDLIYQDPDYSIYRFFQGPYASLDVESLELDDEAPLDWLTEVRLSAEELESADAIWPRSYPLDAHSRAALGRIDGTRTLAEITGGSRELRELIERLVKDGVVDPGTVELPAAQTPESSARGS